MKHALRFLTFLFLVFVGERAMACPEGYYRDDFGLCLPGGGTVIQQLDPRTQISYGLQILDGIATGDGDKIKAGIGGMILQTQCPVACDTVATNVLPDLDAAQLRKIVGEGFIVFAVTGDPYLTIVDTAANVARQIEIKKKTLSTIPGVPPPLPRAKKTYASTATCLGLHRATNKMVAAWIQAPTFTSVEGTFVYPMIDLRTGDVVQLSAPPCEQMDNPEAGYVSLTTGLLVYDDGNVVPGGPEQLKFFIWGQQAANDGTPMVAGQ